MTDVRQLLREGRAAEALDAARAAHANAPDDPQAQMLLGIASAMTGQAQAAQPLLAAALGALGAAGEARHWRLLAQVNGQLGDTASEAKAWREAADREPQNAASWLHLAAALVELGRHKEALAPAREALRLDDGPNARRVYLQALGGVGVVDADAMALMRRALSEAWMRSEALQPLAIALVRAGAADLLPALLTSGPIRDPVLERELTELRRNILWGAPATLEMRAALASQAFINEYAWAVTPEEEARVEGLLDAEGAEDLMTLAAYRPLGELAGAGRWLGADLPDPARRVVEQQIAEPRAERTAVAGLPALTPIRAGVSQAVREQYEQNPYPRWVRMPARAPQTPEVMLRSQFPRARVEPIPGGATPEVLIAGCGTGQHAIEAAQRFAGGQVLGVDLSRASLGYASRKTRELGLANVTYAQADLLELKDRAFDVIECVGVLHHLADPSEGLRALRGLLRPGGVMLLGLYSRAGRRFLEPARVLAGGYPRTPAGIRALRQAILRAPQGDPVRAAATSGDFYSLSTCRDLLMHVQETALSTDDLQRLVEGLNVLGFVLPPEVLRAYRQAFPEDPAGVDLARWGRFEAQQPDTFRGMYQLWLQAPAQA